VLLSTCPEIENQLTWSGNYYFFIDEFSLPFQFCKVLTSILNVPLFGFPEIAVFEYVRQSGHVDFNQLYVGIPQNGIENGKFH